MDNIGSLAGPQVITSCELARSYGSGSFKERTWESGGKKKTAWNGYVYASNGKKVYGSGKTQRAAEAKANAARDKYERSLQALVMAPAPTAEAKPEPTFAEWLDTYNDHKRRQKRADSTLGKYRDYAAEWSALDPGDGQGSLGQRPLRSITITELEEGVAILHARHGAKGRNTVRNKQAYVAGAIRRAALLRLADSEWGAALDPIKRVQKGELELTDEGFASLCRVAGDDAAMLAALVLGRFGLRIGEACGVTADDLVGNVLTLSRQLDRVDTHGEHGPSDALRPKGARVPRGGTTLALCKLKSDAAARKITLTDLEASILMRALDSAKLDTLWDAVDGRWRTVLLVAHAPGGRAQEEQRLRDRWRSLCKRAGLPPTDYHDLRALFGSELADLDGDGRAALPIKAISAALGHTSTQITEIYLRGIRKAPTAAWERTSRAVAQAVGAALR